MRIFIFLFIYILSGSMSLAEKVPAGYVAKWDTSPLIDLDYEIQSDQNCISFAGILKKGK